MFLSVLHNVRILLYNYIYIFYGVQRYGYLLCERVGSIDVDSVSYLTRCISATARKGGRYKHGPVPGGGGVRTKGGIPAFAPFKISKGPTQLL